MGSERVGHDWVTFTYLPTKGLFGLCKMELDSELWSLLTGFSLLCLFGNSKGIQNALLFIMWHSLRNFRKIKISSSCPPNTKYTKYKVGRTLQPSFSQNLVITENSSSSPKALLGWGDYVGKEGSTIQAETSWMSRWRGTGRSVRAQETVWAKALKQEKWKPLSRVLLWDPMDYTVHEIL